MKNLVSLSAVVAASSLMVGCAGAGLTPVAAAPAARGAVVVRGQAAKAVVQGPTVIHAFAMESGGGLYAVPVVTGSDADCSMAPPAGDQGRTAIRPDHRMVMAVDAGQMVCVVTSKTRNFELLWHVQDEGEPRVSEAQFALAARTNKVK